MTDRVAARGTRRYPRITHPLLAMAVAGLLAAGATTVTPRARCDEPSLADKASARDLFTEGMALRAKGDRAGALVKFKDAYALWPSPSTGLELGRTHMQLGELIEARERFIETARLPPKPTETPAAQSARDEAVKLAAELSPRIPSVVFKVSAPSGATVRIALDGRELPSTAPRKINPGKHTIVAKSVGLPNVTVEVDINEGETRELPLTLGADQAKLSEAPADAASNKPAPPALANPPGPEAPSSNALKTYGLIALGVGAVTAGLGGYLAFSSRSAFDDAGAAHCGAAIGAAPGQCDGTGLDDRTSAKGKNHLGVGLLVAGGALVAGGVTLWMLSPSPKASEPVAHATATLTRVGVMPGGFFLEGRF